MSFRPALRPQFRSDDRWVETGDLPFFRLWFEFLLVSPSYELARRERAGTSSKDDVKRWPSDFDRVLEVFDDLGDVQRMTFDDWWSERALSHFGYSGQVPSVVPIDTIFRENPAQLESLWTKAALYIEGSWKKQGEHPSLVFSVPLGMAKDQVHIQLDYLLDHFAPQVDFLTPAPAKYSLLNSGREYKSLFGLLKAMAAKAHYPDMKLHVVGALAALSTTYSQRVLDGRDTDEDRYALRILASRALNKGVKTSENAARGVFPSGKKLNTAVSFDWPMLGKSMESRNEFLDSVSPLDTDDG